MARLSLIGLTVFTVCVGAAAAADDSAETFFELKIRPVLATKCLPCHGGKKSESGLRVDSRESLLKGGDRGPAIEPGKPDDSPLVQAIRGTDEDLKMPPDRPLGAETAAAFAEWVTRGAVWPKEEAKRLPDGGLASRRHWAFERIKPVLPPADPTGWSTRPIDRFVAARRRQARVHAVRAADKRTLIRRATFDLIGLPPTPEEIAEFLHDRAADAYPNLVDRLLGSPHYGERWGRHWMDVVRYADTAGDNADYPVPEAARFRDYIIDSFNRDKPYDQFVREHVAGDILAREGPAASYADSVVATGFLALSRRYATAPFELWHLTLEDTIETTGRAFLGLTLRCARCHDHKFDPVSQRDYYALYGIFASTTFPYAGSEELHSKQFPRMNFVPLVEPGVSAPQLKAYHDRVADLERQTTALDSKKEAGAQEQLSRLRAECARLKRTSIPMGLPAAYSVTEGTPADVPVQRRGDPANSGPVVPRGVPRFAFLDGKPAPSVSASGSGRLELARWLTRPDNSLVPRVMVNRIWQHHFGRGIVATPSNFGLRGEPPTHPELLDWLASQFIASGWSLKAIHREIVLSETYQLSSELDPANAARDPENRWLWRFPRRRLDAESIRDAMLAVSGDLERSRPGPHPFPPIESWRWTQHDPFKAVYPSRHRSVYLMTQRLVKHPFLALFDGPDTNASTDTRSVSTVPLQALYLMNNPFVLEQASIWARRLVAASCAERETIARAFESAWGRLPEPAELDRALGFVHEYHERAAAAGAPSESAALDAWTSFAKVMLNANEFLYVD
jgi:hypothetical protein